MIDTNKIEKVFVQRADEIRNPLSGQELLEESARLFMEVNTLEESNWFTVNGDIRIDKNMTTLEFIDFLDSMGIEFLGSAGVSNFTDELYEGEEKV